MRFASALFSIISPLQQRSLLLLGALFLALASIPAQAIETGASCDPKEVRRLFANVGRQKRNEPALSPAVLAQWEKRLDEIRGEGRAKEVRASVLRSGLKGQEADTAEMEALAKELDAHYWRSPVEGGAAERNLAGHVSASGAEVTGRLTSTIKAKYDLGLDGLIAGAARLPSEKEADLRLREFSKLWQKARPTDELQAELALIRGTGKVTEGFEERTYQLRANLKSIRFLCESLCTKETQANQLDSLTKAFGHLADAVKSKGAEEEVKAAAAKLLEEMSATRLAAVDREMELMKAEGFEKLEKRIRHELASIHDTLSAKKITEEEYHEVRKGIGRLQTIVLSNTLVDGGIKDEAATFQAFRKLYDQIGEVHQEMELAKLNKTNYGKIAFTAENRSEIEKVLEYFRDPVKFKASDRYSPEFLLTRLSGVKEFTPEQMGKIAEKLSKISKESDDPAFARKITDRFLELSGHQKSGQLETYRQTFLNASDLLKKNKSWEWEKAWENGLAKTMEDNHFTPKMRDGQQESVKDFAKRFALCWN